MRLELTEDEIMLINVSLDALEESLAVTIISMEAVIENKQKNQEYNQTTVSFIQTQVQEAKIQLQNCKALLKKVEPLLDEGIESPKW